MLHENPSRTVKLFWSDRQGSVCPATGCSAPSARTDKISGSIMAPLRGFSMASYSFDTQVNMTSSMSKFWFEIDEGDGSKPVLVDNDGAGIPLTQDDVLFDLARTSFSFEGVGLNLNIVIAVRYSSPPLPLCRSRIFGRRETLTRRPRFLWYLMPQPRRSHNLSQGRRP